MEKIAMFLLTAALLLLAPRFAAAQEKRPAPFADPPFYMTARAVEADRDGPIALPPRVVRKVVQETHTRTVKGAPVTYTVYRTVTYYEETGEKVEGRKGQVGIMLTISLKELPPQRRFLLVDGKNVKLAGRDGKALDPRTAVKQFNEAKYVLVFTQGVIDPYYMRQVPRGAVIVTALLKLEPGQKIADRKHVPVDDDD